MARFTVVTIKFIYLMLYFLYSIIVKDGPLTSKLKDIKIDDDIILMPKPTGTLVLDALKPGKRLFLLSSGTGFAPFSSLIREPETFEKFEKVIVTHTCRTVKELGYSEDVIKNALSDELISEFISNKLVYYQTEMLASLVMRKRFLDSKESPFTLVKSELN